MMKKLALLLLILATISIIADARMPQKGDYVQIRTWDGIASTNYFGNITEIGNGLICLNCTGNRITVVGLSPETNMSYGPIDICIGTGQINAMSWMN